MELTWCIYRRAKRASKLLGLLMLAELIVACGSGPPNCPPPCPPFCTQKPTPQPSSATIKSAQLFFDGSGSIRGFLPNKRELSTAYTDVIQNLIDQLPQTTSNVNYYKFGGKVESIASADLPQLFQSDFYKCSKKSKRRKADCDNKESRIDIVLSTVQNTAPDILSVIVTDLFLSDSTVLGQQQQGLRRELTKIIHSGRTIALFGISSQFEGEIMDLPSGGKYNGAKFHPFYVIAIGPPATLQQINQKLNADVLSVLPDDSHHVAIFSTAIDTIIEQGWFANKIQLAKGAKKSPYRIRHLSPEIPQLQFSRKLRDVLMIDAPGKFTLSQELWSWSPRYAKRGCDSGWQKFPNPPPVINLLPKDNIVQLHLPGSLSGLLPERFYALAGELITETIVITTDKPWMQHWSFKAETEKKLVASKPKFFPTLNLAVFENILTSAISKKLQGRQAGKFYVVFRLNR